MTPDEQTAKLKEIDAALNKLAGLTVIIDGSDEKAVRLLTESARNRDHVERLQAQLEAMRSVVARGSREGEGE